MLHAIFFFREIHETHGLLVLLECKVFEIPGIFFSFSFFLLYEAWRTNIIKDKIEQNVHLVYSKKMESKASKYNQNILLKVLHYRFMYFKYF